MKSATIQKKLENSILFGLSREWETALWVLPPDIRSLIKKPLFSLGQHKKQLAYWNSERREISFSREFALNYPWDSIKEVLLHEMAHQLTHEVLKIKNQPPHGPAFRKACVLLKANPKASGSYPPLSERVKNGYLDEKDKTLVKIKKLLALGESKNIHEAESAVAKAHHFIEKYNIDLLEHDAERNFISVFVGKPSLRHFKEEYLLAKLLTEHYFVYGIWVTSYVIEKEKMGRVLEISGTPHNVKIASYVYDFIRNQINIAWNLYNSDKGLNRYHKSDFSAGVIEGFDAKLKAQKNSDNKNSSPNGKNKLKLINDPKLKEYASNKYPGVKNFKRTISNQDQTIVKDGEKIGRKIILAHGVEEKKKKIHLIEF